MDPDDLEEDGDFVYAVEDKSARVGRIRFQLPEIMLRRAQYHGCFDILRRKPFERVQIPDLQLNEEEFKAFYKSKQLFLDGVDIRGVFDELMDRVRFLRGEKTYQNLWRPVREMEGLILKDYVALFAMALFYFPFDLDLAVALLFCVNRIGKADIRRRMKQIAKGQFFIYH